MSQKRVAVVLASLVGTLTLSAGLLLLMEGGTLGNTPLAAAFSSQSIQAQIVPEVPLQPDAWQYIIVYESGDLAASAASLADGQVTGGSELPAHSVRPKANFHFVIDSARSGRHTMDGQLEVGTSWLRQASGAPYVGWPDSRYYPHPPYTDAVGVCLIGDLNRAPVSEAQHRTLVQLVRELQRDLNVPKSHVLFQWELGPNATHASNAEVAYAANFRRSLD